MQPVKGHVQCMIHHDSVVLVPVPIDFLSCCVNTIVLCEYHCALFGYLCTAGGFCGHCFSISPELNCLEITIEGKVK